MAYSQQVFIDVRFNENNYTRHILPNKARLEAEDTPVAFSPPPISMNCDPYYDGQSGRSPDNQARYMEPLASAIDVNR